MKQRASLDFRPFSLFILAPASLVPYSSFLEVPLGLRFPWVVGK